MPVLVPGLVVVVEDLVVVGVDKDRLKVGLGHEPVEGVERLEPVRDDKGETGLGGRAFGDPGVPSSSVCVVPVLPSGLEELVILECGGLVEECKHGDDLPVVGVRVFAGECLDDLLGAVDVVGVGGPDISSI